MSSRDIKIGRPNVGCAENNRRYNIGCRKGRSGRRCVVAGKSSATSRAHSLRKSARASIKRTGTGEEIAWAVNPGSRCFTGEAVKRVRYSNARYLRSNED